jgi:predicted Zn-dependent protease
MKWTDKLEEKKRKFAEKFADASMLSRLVTVALNDVGFRIALMISPLIIILPLISLTKIWTVSPEGFSPIVEVSLLDLAQAWSLKRNAVLEEKVENWEKSYHGWRSAMFNNLANPELVEGTIRTGMKREASKRDYAVELSFFNWLFQLTNTNSTYSGLVNDFYQDYPNHSFLLNYTESLEPDEQSFDLQKSYLKALFETGKIQKFDEQWKRLEKKTEISEDSELEMYRAAYLMIWGSSLEKMESQSLLKKNQNISELWLSANQLLLRVADYRKDPDLYDDSLQQLDLIQEGFILPHAGYWMLLGALGRNAEGIRLAKEYNRDPSSSMETLSLVRAFHALKATEESIELIEEYNSKFSFNSNIWILFADIFIESEEWERLYGLALRGRGDVPDSAELIAYSHFLQGLANYKLDKPVAASRSIEELDQLKFKDFNLLMKIAHGLNSIGYTEMSQALLLDTESDTPKTLNYWIELISASAGNKDSEFFLKATKEAYQLNSERKDLVNNYAAALLITRQRPEEAISLTWTLLNAAPESYAFKINHASALLQNQRLDEAEEIFQTMDSERIIGSAIVSNFHYVRADLMFNLGNYTAAAESAAQVDEKHLFDAQKEWLKQLLESLDQHER